MTGNRPARLPLFSLASAAPAAAATAATQGFCRGSLKMGCVLSFLLDSLASKRAWPGPFWLRRKLPPHTSAGTGEGLPIPHSGQGARGLERVPGQGESTGPVCASTRPLAAAAAASSPLLLLGVRSLQHSGVGWLGASHIEKGTQSIVAHPQRLLPLLRGREEPPASRDCRNATLGLSTQEMLQAATREVGLVLPACACPGPGADPPALVQRSSRHHVQRC